MTEFNISDYSPKAQLAYEQLLFASSIEDERARNAARRKALKNEDLEEIPQRFWPSFPPSTSKTDNGTKVKIVLGVAALVTAFLIYKITSA